METLYAIKVAEIRHPPSEIILSRYCPGAVLALSIPKFVCPWPGSIDLVKKSKMYGDYQNRKAANLDRACCVSHPSADCHSCLGV